MLVLGDACAYATALIHRLERQAAAAQASSSEMDFAFLFDRKRKLMRVGYDVNTGAADPAYYDLLATEARTAVFVAIAKGDLPREAWFHLGRKLTAYKGTARCYSWSGTMFEYLMPALFMRTYDEHAAGRKPASRSCGSSRRTAPSAACRGASPSRPTARATAP